MFPNKTVINGKTILAIGSHPDDIELGCGGSLLYFSRQGYQIYTVICSYGELKSPTKVRKDENIKSNRYLNTKKTYCLGLKDGEINHNTKLVNLLENIVNEVKPNIIFSHSLRDHHQDHLNVARATISALRHKKTTLIMYPNLSSICQPKFNFYIDISKFMTQKLEIINNFESQKSNWYMNTNYLTSCAISAGHLINCEYAERFFLYFSCLD